MVCRLNVCLGWPRRARTDDLSMLSDDLLGVIVRFATVRRTPALAATLRRRVRDHVQGASRVGHDVMLAIGPIPEAIDGDRPMGPRSQLALVAPRGRGGG